MYYMPAELISGLSQAFMMDLFARIINDCLLIFLNIYVDRFIVYVWRSPELSNISQPMSKYISFDIINIASTLVFTAVFGIYCNSFIALPIREKFCQFFLFSFLQFKMSAYKRFGTPKRCGNDFHALKMIT